MEQDSDTLREQLAELEHAQWADYMDYFLGRLDQQADGSLVVHAGYVAALRRQIATHYDDLLPQEQDGDRAEADRVLAIIRSSACPP